MEKEVFKLVQIKTSISLASQRNHVTQVLRFALAVPNCCNRRRLDLLPLQLRPDPQPQEVYHESFTGSRFPSAVPPSQLEKNTVKTCEFVLSRFAARFFDRELASISHEKVLDFLLILTKDNKQATKRNRFSVLSSFYNFSISIGLPPLVNPCNTTVIKKIFKRPPPIQLLIVDKDTIDEIIFRTTDKRNRLMLELMVRGDEGV